MRTFFYLLKVIGLLMMVIYGVPRIENGIGFICGIVLFVNGSILEKERD